MTGSRFGVRWYEFSLLIAVSVIVLGLGSIIAYDLRQSADTASRLYERLAAGRDLIGELQFTTQEVRRTVLYALHTIDANRQLEYVDQSRAADANVQKLLADQSALTSAPGAQERLRTVAIAWSRYLAERDEVIGLILEGSLTESVGLDETTGAARFNDVRLAIDDLSKTFHDEAATQVERARERATRATVRLTGLVASALLAVAVGIYLINRRAALEQLLSSEAHKGSILQAVPDPIISTDANRRIIEFNDAAERVFTVPRTAALGVAIETVIVPPHARDGLIALLAAPSSETPTTIPATELVGCRANGDEFPMELAVVTHTVGGDRIWTFHIADVTAWHRSEEQLRAARDAAEAADRAKSDFLATMSHELRTPLTAVVGASNLLQGVALPPPQVQLVRTIKSSANALMALVSDILDYSRIEARLVELVPATFALEECIEQALDQVTEFATRKGLAVSVVVDPAVPPRIYADAGRVRQVLVNLLSNAVKFSDTGEIAVRACAEAAAGDGVIIEIVVRDTGRGIPAHLVPRLFQRFTRVGSGGAGEPGGAGLGLAISRRLSELLGGTLTVESQENVGSTFTFRFCARVVAATDLRADAQPSRELVLGALTVLLVEDHDPSRQVLRMMLEELGLTVDEAANGTEAVARAGLTPYDVILMDVQLPGLDGLEATRRIKQRAAARAPSIVALTAAATASDERRCREAGMEAFLLKPVRLEALAAVIRRAVMAHSVERPQSATHEPSRAPAHELRHFSRTARTK